MSLESYVAELEKLIVLKYVPAYTAHCEETGMKPVFDKVTQNILMKKPSTEICALLKPRTNT